MAAEERNEAMIAALSKAYNMELETVIHGVIGAEEAAIAQYRKIIELAGGFDPATEDLAITALADEEEHRREFKGFLKELETGRLG
jgi:bacterioferritin